MFQSPPSSKKNDSVIARVSTLTSSKGHWVSTVAATCALDRQDVGSVATWQSFGKTLGSCCGSEHRGYRIYNHFKREHLGKSHIIYIYMYIDHLIIHWELGGTLFDNKPMFLNDLWIFFGLIENNASTWGVSTRFHLPSPSLSLPRNGPMVQPSNLEGNIPKFKLSTYYKII